LEASVARPGVPATGIATWTAAAALAVVTVYLGWRPYLVGDSAEGFAALVRAVSGAASWAAVLVGFVAQAIDGALGMAYGITATTFLKAVRRQRVHRKTRSRHVGELVLFGGFVDAAGGGGWGPVVTSTLPGSGTDPRTTIGSVNFAEFFLTLATGASFMFLVGAGPWPAIAGLVIGGLFAVPLAASLCRHLPARTRLLLVGILVTGLSLFNVLSAIAI
jgi:hypothetical protein